MEVKLIGCGTLSGNLFQNANPSGHFHPKALLALRLRFGKSFLLTKNFFLPNYVNVWSINCHRMYGK